MHSMQAGYLEKAQKYTDKALMQLEKLKSERGLSDATASIAVLSCLALQLHRVFRSDYVLHPMVPL